MAVAARSRPGLALPHPLTPVVLARRVNRFAVEARAGRHRLYLHLPNSGRMRELLRPGARGLAWMHSAAGRRTQGTLLLVRLGRRWVGLDARVPNHLFAAVLNAAPPPPFRGCRIRRREVRVKNARIDFLLQEGPRTCLVETKSCNRVVRGVALFPDAPTTRGAVHLRILAHLRQQGRRAAVVWFVQRDDAR